MNSTKIMIAMAAVLLAAAFAGVVLIDDDADAAEDAVTYKVTYIYGDNVSTKTVNAGEDGTASVEFPTFVAVFGESVEDEISASGYEFSKWKVGSSVYAVDGTMTITSDVVIEPVLTAAVPIVKLVYGDVAVEYFDAESTASKYVITLADLKDFAKKIGATVLYDGVAISDSATDIDEKVSLYIEGYKYNGFDKGADALVKIAELKGEGEKVTAYTAVFEEVYDVSFVIEGVTTVELSSDKVVLNRTEDSFRTLPTAPVKTNHIFMGWYTAEGEKVIGYSADKDEYTYAVADYKFTEDTVLYANFVPVTFTVSFVYGSEKTVFTTETVKYGERAIEPKDLPTGYSGWDFDFSLPVLGDMTIVAIEAEPITIYDVTFEIEGKTPVTQKSDSLVLPDTAREGFAFQGWVVKGASQYVDPMNYDIKGDITFVAVYKEVAPPAPEEPGFFETTEGKCVLVLIGVMIIALGYAYVKNMFGMKDFLGSFRIQRVKK